MMTYFRTVSPKFVVVLTLFAGLVALLGGCSERGPLFKATDITGAEIGGDLAQYVSAFDPSFLSLRGSQVELETVAKQFKVFHRKNPSPSGGYTMDHTAGSFVFDKQGRIRLLVPYGAGPAVFTHDLARLLS